MKGHEKKFIVVFQDEDNTVLKTSFVKEGEDACPPEMKRKKSETKHHQILFSGWDTEYQRVKKNLVIKAVYQKVPKKYLVMYFHENDKMLGMESVSYGSPAKAEIFPTKESDEEFDYIFSGWSRSLDCVKGDMNVRALFEKKRKTFVVRFFLEQGVLLQQKQIAYGQKVDPPAPPEKKRDQVYSYVFQGWTENTDCVKKNMDVFAVFENCYNVYTVTFYEEQKKIQMAQYHYGDSIVYPSLQRKGYTLMWSQQPETVDQNYEIHAKWSFSNPKGKKVKHETGEYKILNPSVKNGTVCCLYYIDPISAVVRMPDRIKLGDYFYKIEEIGPGALKHCIHMRKLELPDTIKKINDHGLAQCRQLQEIYFGKKLASFGANIFAEDIRLRQVVMSGEAFKHCHRKAFEKLPSEITIKVIPKFHDKVKKILECSWENKKIIIN